MIEVERKFIIEDQNPTFLTKSKARFLKEINLTDTYYDDPNYSLTTKNIWTRKRNNKWEVKKPISHNLIDRYEELVDDKSIREYLVLADDFPMEEALTQKGYKPFVTYKTNRRSYEIAPFHIDIDYVDFGDWSYYVGEIELLIEDIDQIDKAATDIVKFAKKHNLEITKAPGKLVLFLKETDSKHYQALVKAGIIKQNYDDYEKGRLRKRI